MGYPYSNTDIRYYVYSISKNVPIFNYGTVNAKSKHHILNLLVSLSDLTCILFKDNNFDQYFD